MASPKQRCIALAAKLGVILDTTDGEVNCEAPTGMIWQNAEVHELVNSPWDSETQADMFKQAYERMRGDVLVPCWHKAEGACDWCDGAEGGK